MMRECPKCQSLQIEEGYVPDNGYGAIHAPAFHPGKPDKRWWGVKMDKKALIPISTYRCARCGYLESFAKA